MASNTKKNQETGIVQQGVDFNKLAQKSNGIPKGFWQQVDEKSYTFESVKLKDVANQPLNGFDVEYVQSNNYEGSDGFWIMTCTDQNGEGFRVRSGSKMFAKFASDASLFWQENPTQAIPFVAVTKPNTKGSEDSYEIISVSRWLEMQDA